MIGDGSSMLVYSSDGIKTIADDNYFYDIVYLKEIENNLEKVRKIITLSFCFT